MNPGKEKKNGKKEEKMEVLDLSFQIKTPNQKLSTQAGSPSLPAFSSQWF